MRKDWSLSVLSQAGPKKKAGLKQLGIVLKFKWVKVGIGS